ncbi:N-acetyltransferase family protein [Streptomyces sp. URMC 129]|uniref:GNAT family N-acetyltransferase n=1 Tax=Streptomyces sp. URMC 129 TaxID=3423407 RepID=UPI003F1B607F
MSTVFLRRLSRWQAETDREQIADLYVAAHQDTPGPRPLPREEFVHAFADHDLGRPGFDLVLAGDPKPVGCAYGFQLPEVPPGLAELAGTGRVFLLAGLMVVPRRRGQGVATRMQRELLSRAGADLVLARPGPGNAPAHAALRSWGWVEAGDAAWVRPRHAGTTGRA